ncbi:Concanavalin A-like lectin/glucanases superfamily protein [Cyclobacterium xiamenense]|uniref:Concanavalin A-like lectin/glucanases superfamily protein n=1 Tax=Cyclobacterium xiamenense TaxID=1297121 RepID=A0A1H7BMP8_9BACT|nr:LamG-like jellyroll fold domain-containing protein [Cyclobacterium xiamenense]SEJ78993.1 Concanavalin A-like lectin/glucanases superfamily protein [Cyclobacterium xiamenense]
MAGKNSRCALILFVFIWVTEATGRQDPVAFLSAKEGLVALWDFREPSGMPRKAVGKGDFPLEERNGRIPRVEEGPLSGYAAHLDNQSFFSLPHDRTGALNVHGKMQGITVMAWVKWYGMTGFVGGMWNEYTDGGKRQYGLFVDLPHYNGANQVCGHVSATGGPTPPFPYSCDYSASKQQLTKGQWHVIAFTYDGTYIKSYLDGEFQERPPEPIKNTKGFPGLPEGLVHSKNPYYFPDGIGNNGSDFTVGAVVLQRGMGNFFNGLIGGLAVFDRVVEASEMQEISRMTMRLH